MLSTDPLQCDLGMPSRVAMFMLPFMSLFGFAKMIEAFVNFPARGRFLACMLDLSSYPLWEPFCETDLCHQLT